MTQVNIGSQYFITLCAFGYLCHRPRNLIDFEWDGAGRGINQRMTIFALKSAQLPFDIYQALLIKASLLVEVVYTIVVDEVLFASQGEDFFESVVPFVWLCTKLPVIDLSVYVPELEGVLLKETFGDEVLKCHKFVLQNWKVLPEAMSATQNWYTVEGGTIVTTL